MIFGLIMKIWSKVMTNKIFQIGFNKCATRSFAWFFHMNEVPSVHWDGGMLSKRMEENHSHGNNLLSGYEDFTFYSDMMHSIEYKAEGRIAQFDMESNRYFKTLDLQYPNSKFILNIRPIEDWLRSRFRHNKFKFSKKSMWHYALDWFCKDVGQPRMFDIWRKTYQEHVHNVKNYFKDRPHDLLIYDISKDEPQKILDFFPELDLDISHWKNTEFDVPLVYGKENDRGGAFELYKPVFRDRRREKWMKAGSPPWYVKNFAHWLLWHYEHGNILYPKNFKLPKKSKVVLVERQTRILLNHSEVKKTLREYCEQNNMDFVNIDTATISVDEQIDLFKDATTIIGVHGAGLANCFWMPPKSAYCEFSIEHWPLLKGKNHHEGMIWNEKLVKDKFHVTRFLCEKEKSEQYHVESRNRRITEWRDWNLYVDIDRFKKQLKEIVV
tara:strand:+ start:46952 stop:48268 length:1317 start_codon:yes stop_codon:yes gene_type:complete